MRARAIQLHPDPGRQTKKSEPLSGHDLLVSKRAIGDARSAHGAGESRHGAWRVLDRRSGIERSTRGPFSVGIAMSLSAALLLQTAISSAVSLYQSDSSCPPTPQSRRQGLCAARRLNRIAMSFASPNNRYRVRRAIQWFEKNGCEIDSEDYGYRYLVRLIRQTSVPADRAPGVQPVSFVGRMAGFFTTISFDTLMSLRDQGVFVPSLLFWQHRRAGQQRNSSVNGWQFWSRPLNLKPVTYCWRKRPSALPMPSSPGIGDVAVQLTVPTVAQSGI